MCFESCTVFDMSGAWRGLKFSLALPVFVVMASPEVVGPCPLDEEPVEVNDSLIERGRKGGELARRAEVAIFLYGMNHEMPSEEQVDALVAPSGFMGRVEYRNHHPPGEAPLTGKERNALRKRHSSADRYLSSLRERFQKDDRVQKMAKTAEQLWSKVKEEKKREGSDDVVTPVTVQFEGSSYSSVGGSIGSSSSTVGGSTGSSSSMAPQPKRQASWPKVFGRAVFEKDRKR